MKTKIIFRLGLCLLSVLILSNCYSQKIALNASYYNPRWEINPGNISSLEKIISDEKVTDRILIYFNKNFRNAENIRWEQEEEKLIATFEQAGITTRSIFNKNGRLMYTIDFFSTEMLPNAINKMLKKNYSKYVITTAAKISEANRKIWVIKLEGKEDFATVRIEDGQMEEVENFQKQD